ncbi:hypothetical protein HY492_00450 [Candidatus Woesearchaeota archaeon]|nr:hypothetical protein [Candidatus Woesearchaeota archaeon]
MRLTWALFSRFAGRKGNALSFLVDTATGAIQMVPQDAEHIDFAATLLECEREDIRNDPKRASHLVPVVVEYLNDELLGMLVGTSGMEIAYGVRHSKNQLDRAQALAHGFLEDGEVPLAQAFKETVLRRWQA